MKPKNGASEKSSTSANEQDSIKSTSENPQNTQLTESHMLENTPFIIVRADTKYFVACGKYRLTTMLDTEEEAEEFARRITWNNITAVIGIIVEAEIDKALERKTLDNIHRLVTENEEEK